MRRSRHITLGQFVLASLCWILLIAATIAVAHSAWIEHYTR
jgi:hypothetical protein